MPRVDFAKVTAFTLNGQHLLTLLQHLYLANEAKKRNEHYEKPYCDYPFEDDIALQYIFQYGLPCIFSKDSSSVADMRFIVNVENPHDKMLATHGVQHLMNVYNILAEPRGNAAPHNWESVPAC